MPYLAPPTEPYTKLDSVLAPYRAKRRIGVAWAGRETHRNDANRSCALVHFVDLAEQPDLALFSLQKGPRSLANADTPPVSRSPIYRSISRIFTIPPRPSCDSTW